MHADHATHPRNRRAPSPSPASGWAAWGCRSSTAPPTSKAASTTIHRALDLGVTLPRHRRHVRPVHQRAARRAGDRRTAATRSQLATKFGNKRGPRRRAARHRRLAGVRPRRPATPRCSASASTTSTSTTSTASTRRVPIEETVGAMAELVAGRQGPPPRPVRGERRHHPHGPRRAPDHRAADRVLAVHPRRRGRDPAGVSASSASAWCPTRRSGADC